ncbi:MAG: virulence RhuM family protein [Bacteroidales bacterium]|nr:virulence RhuM family protein [Bacteroidales bacterium]
MEIENVNSNVVGEKTEFSGEIVLYQPNNDIRLEVRIAEETVWLSQAQMAELFGTQRQAITKHLKNIFETKELNRQATSSILELVQKEGKRLVNRQVELFNLDVIISIGYRVNTQQGILFRQWAIRILRDYLMKGYSVNNRLEHLEQRVSKTEEKIDFFINTSLPPLQGIFYDGQIFDAYAFVCDLIKKAKKSITLIDNYVDESVLVLLAKRKAGVSAKIYTHGISQQLQLDLARHNSQYPAIEVETFNKSHDRFLMIDDEVYHIGASLKDLGKKWFGFTLMSFISSAEILAKINEG